MISTSCRLSYNNLHVISYVVLDYHLAEFKHVGFAALHPTFNLCLHELSLEQLKKHLAFNAGVG